MSGKFSWLRGIMTGKQDKNKKLYRILMCSLVIRSMILALLKTEQKQLGKS